MKAKKKETKHIHIAQHKTTLRSMTIAHTNKSFQMLNSTGLYECSIVYLCKMFAAHMRTHTTSSSTLSSVIAYLNAHLTDSLIDWRNSNHRIKYIVQFIDEIYDAIVFYPALGAVKMGNIAIEKPNRHSHAVVNNTRRAMRQEQYDIIQAKLSIHDTVLMTNGEIND